MMNVEKIDKWLERIREGYRTKDDSIEETKLRLEFFNAQALLEILRKLDKPKKGPRK